MNKIAVGVLLCVVASVMAAPAPFARRQHPQAKRYWTIDLRPLDNMPAKEAYKILLDFESSTGQGEREVQFLFAISDGRIRIAHSHTDENGKKLKEPVVKHHSVDRSLSAAEGIREVLREEGVACGRGTVTEVNPRFKVKIQHLRMPEGCVPVIGYGPR